MVERASHSPPDSERILQGKFERLVRIAGLEPARAKLLAETPLLHSGWELDDHIFLFEYDGRKRIITSQATDGAPVCVTDLKTYLDLYRQTIASTEAFLELANGADWTPLA